MDAQELKDLLREARNLLILCTLIDRSGKCEELVDKIDTKITWN